MRREARARAILAFGGSFKDAMDATGLSLEEVERAWATQDGGASPPSNQVDAAGP